MYGGYQEDLGRKEIYEFCETVKGREMGAIVETKTVFISKCNNFGTVKIVQYQIILY